MAEFVKAIQASALTPGQGTLVELNGTRILIFSEDGALYAIDEVCPHDQGPLSEGELDGKVITCPWHDAMFDIQTGAVVDGPADEGVRCYEVKLDGEDVLVKI
ncbi:MAG: non-heme iron oxygenase ferredoxin subunit [Planctomycetes bacterium]|nr:non-heme iron oxygenase ferredoxin subunit [Planctomycetota bacterium]